MGTVDLGIFKASLRHPSPPAGLSSAVCALWWDAKGQWQKAHECAQEQEGKPAAWVHAYLHRKEGDAANADYWYRRAGQPTATTSLTEEWEAIARTLLEGG
jgi:hypothetical protein